MGEICDGMQAMAGKLNHLGMEKSPAKSTVGDGLRGRDSEFFKEVYFMLLTHFKETLSFSRIDNVYLFRNFSSSIAVRSSYFQTL